MINPDWHRAVLRKYEPPVSWRPVDFARSRLAGTVRMLSAGLLRLSPVSMPFVAGFFQDREMGLEHLRGDTCSGSSLPGYRAAPAPEGRTGFHAQGAGARRESRVSGTRQGLSFRPLDAAGSGTHSHATALNLVPRWKANAPTPGALSPGHRAGGGRTAPYARTIRLTASNGNGSVPWIVARTGFPPSYIRPGAAAPGALHTEGGAPPGGQGRQKAVQDRVAGRGRDNTVHTGGYSFPGAIARQGLKAAGKEVSAGGKAASGLPGISHALDQVLARRAYPPQTTVPQESRMAGGAMSVSVPDRSSPALGNAVPQAGSRVPGARVEMPLFEKQTAGSKGSLSGLPEATWLAGTDRVTETSPPQAPAQGAVASGTILLQSAAMGPRPWPALVEHVVQRVGQGSLVNVTSLVLQSRAIKGRAGTLAREVAGRAGGGPGAGAGINRDVVRAGSAGVSRILFPGAVTPAGDTAGEGRTPVDVLGGHGDAAVFSKPGYPDPFLSGHPSSPAFTPGLPGMSSALQARAMPGGQGPSTFIFRAETMEMPVTSGGTSGQQAPYVGDESGNPAAFQAPLSGGAGVGQEMESSAGAPAESSPMEVDLERLADEVYLILERRLVMERESTGL